MAEEEVKVGGSDPGGSEGDSEILTKAMVGEKETSPEKPEGEPEKPEGDLPKKVEEKAEKLEEKAEVKAPDGIEAQTQKLFDQHKGNPKKLAEILANQYSLQAKQTGELGDLRKKGLEYDTLVKRIHDDPDAVKKDIDALNKKEDEESSLLERAYTDPEVLTRFITDKVDERVGEKERQGRIEKEMERLYSDYKQTETQRKEMADQIQAGRFTYQELVHLVVRGFYAPESLKDAKELAREEDKVVLAKKKGAEVDKQGVIDTEEKPQTDAEIVTKALLEAKR